MNRNMKNYILLLLFGVTLLNISNAQNYPTFGNEIPVTINGLNFDAMEPFISSDGNTLFFNSLNSGGNTNLYYANRINDSTYNYTGILSGTVDTSSNHLDAVASLDTNHRFYWVSLRDYPNQIQNLHSGIYNGTEVSDLKRVYGDFNIPVFGWIIMDAAISNSGNELYYCNAYFDFINNTCAGLPCDARLGIAQKVNDTTFNKFTNTDSIFSLLNDTNYLVYAPQVSYDGLELYFTRLLKGTFNTQICVAVRSSINNNFSTAQVIHQNNGFVPEGPTISSDKTKLYYHQKNNGGLHKIFLRYRTNAVGSFETNNNSKLKLYPNPVLNQLNLVFDDLENEFIWSIYSIEGQFLCSKKNQNNIEFSNFPKGIYILKVETENSVYFEHIVK